MLFSKTLKAAFFATMPVLMGYAAIGFAFGVLIGAGGYSGFWAGIMSLCIYGGALQYLAVDWFIHGVTIAQVITVSIIINIRHILYGLTLFDKLRGLGPLKPYTIFSLTDETYALLSSTQAPVGVNEKLYYFFIGALNHSYWIIFSMIGAFFGSVITFDVTGMEFAMTALFIAIAVEQWQNFPTKKPALIGFACTLIATVFFAPEQILIVSMILILISLFSCRSMIEEEMGMGSSLAAATSADVFMDEGLLDSAAENETGKE